MPNYLTIINHLDMEHQIMQTGLVRKFAETWDVIHLFVKEQDEYAVNAMYKDIDDKVRLITLKTTSRHEIEPKIPYDTTILKLATYDAIHKKEKELKE